MSELHDAIAAALKKHGGWSTPLQLRDMLPNGFSRGEAFDFALTQMIAARRVENRITGDMRLVRLAVDQPASAPQPPQPFVAPGPGSAVTGAFHPAPPKVRLQMVGNTDEVQPPRQKPPRKESRMPSTTLKKPEQILDLLAEKPMTKADIAKALGLKEPATYFHLKNLAKAKKIHRVEEGNVWTLLNGKGAPPSLTAAQAKPGPVQPGVKKRVAAATKLRVVSGKNSGGVDDVDLKLQVLDNHIDAAREAGRAVSAYILGQIRDDLERLAA